MTKDFLVEIGTEELPPTALLKLSNSFSELIESSLRTELLALSKLQSFATPRRLTVLVSDLDEQTPSKDIVVWGPPKAIAFDKDGKPSRAAEGFAKKNGLSLDQLICENDGKAEKLVHRSSEAGRATSDMLESIVQTALDKLPIAKRMRWGASRIEFVRPSQWIVLMFGSDIIPANILGLNSGNTTRGHRFHCDTTLDIANPASYPALLKDSGHIIASYEERKSIIRQQVVEQGDKVGGVAIIDEDLLDEVTGLVEWPTALTGSFEQRFLSVPAEALISSMKEHQKYFHVEDSNGNLMPHFITVSNIVSKDPAQVISGNERVIRPRLSDAAFFYETDKKHSLESRLDKLKSIVFQQKLGSLFDKSQRVMALSGYIAEQLNSNSDYAKRAAQLSKTDLVSDMVLEFDKMQGIAGCYYALADGEPEEVANAIKDQYLPKFAGDALPDSLTGCAVALADRLDTLVGIFGIGQPPTGSKDPFALRRSSLGVLRIIIEKQLNLDLRCLLEQAQQQHQTLPANEGLVDTVLAYMIERFRAWYEDQNIPAEVFMAVSAKDLSQPLDFDQRIQAVHSFNQLPEAQSLAAANKRVSNLLAKLDDTAVIGKVNPELLSEAAEIALAEQVEQQSRTLQPLFEQREYQQALASLAGLRSVVDTFFDDVMVMVDDETVRNNRLALLKQLRDLFLEIADISLLVASK
jgi:glycyl-tRNA synthetase beta chain